MSDAIRCLKLEVVEWNDKDHRRRCFQLGDRCKQMVNRMWQLWEHWHLQQESPRQIRAYLAALALWQETKSGDKPKLCLTALPAPLSNVIYHACAEEFCDLATRTRGLLQNAWGSKVGKTKGAKGSLSGWMRILLCDDRRPGSINPVPIPFDARNSAVSEDEDGQVTVQVRIERHDIAGRKSGESEVWPFVVKTRGKVARYAQPIYAVARGEAALKGSSLFYDSSRRKWFMLVSYVPPDVPKPDLDAGRVAVLRPAVKRPFVLRLNGLTRWLGERGEAIAHRRRRVLLGRWSRQENYRWATNGRKGHGVRSALSQTWKLQKSWKMFCKTYNESIVTEALKRCVEARCGKLIFLRPKSERFVEVAGKVPGRNDPTGWPWYMLEAFLRRKCQALGITLVEQRQRVAESV